MELVRTLALILIAQKLGASDISMIVFYVLVVVDIVGGIFENIAKGMDKNVKS